MRLFIVVVVVRGAAPAVYEYIIPIIYTLSISQAIGSLGTTDINNLRICL